MFVVSYVIVVAFHQFFNFERILIQRSVSHPKKELISVNYLSPEQFYFKTNETIKQLYDQAVLVSKRIDNNALGVMFGIELTFVKKTLLAWFNKKVCAPFKKLDQSQIIKFEQENPIIWTTKPQCVICKMPLNSVFSSPTKSDSEMYYADYIVRYEYKFLKNLLTRPQLDTSRHLKTLELYYEVFESFIHHCIEIYRPLNNANLKLKDMSADVIEFLEEKFQDECYDYSFIKDEIMLTDIKNIVKHCGNIPKFRLKIYAYVYNELVQFPLGIDFDCLTSKKIFQHVHNQITHKVHLHHSHITGQIIGCSHSFCNKQVLELERPEIPCIAHNLFGFDFWFFMKGFSTTSWCSTQLTAGGTNLTNLNFANLKSELKFIDSLKYYQRSLAELTSSMDKKEIDNSKKNMTIFLKNHHYFTTVWSFLPPTKQTNILTITCEGKGVIPYELVRNIDSFFQTPEKDFWDKTDFYSELKQKHITNEEFENSKFLYKTLKMRNLGDLNDLYNAQDVILLCELIENRFQFMQDKYGFNPSKCNSASSLSGCIEREMSKVIISFPTNVEHLDIFEKTITGGFSCVNTRLAFDTTILLPKKIDGSRNFNFKCIYNINDEKKRVISKILKLDENNQYGHAMTKPLPTGCIKNDPDISWNTFNVLLESVNLNDEIGHLYIVDIKFDTDNATKKQIVYNEIYPTIIEKQKTIDANEKSIYQLLDNLREGQNGPLSYRVTAKAHSTMLPKTFIPLYLEDLAFIIKRYGWSVTKIHKHLTFDQAPFKKNFILMNQKSRQQSKTNTEKDFYKLMNNANFGSDCRNNMDNCDFVPIFDEVNEIYSLQKYYSLIDPKVNSFVSGKLIEDSVNNKFTEKFHALDKNDQFYDIKLASLKSEIQEGLEAAKKLTNKRKNLKRKVEITDYCERMDEVNKKKNVTSLIEFDQQNSNSIKAVMVKKNKNIKPTTRFLSGKILMFAKVSIKSFACDIIDVFMFPDQTTQSIYKKYNVEKCYVFQCLTDTDSTSVNFIFICDKNSIVDEKNARNIIFEVFVSSKILSRLDLADDFWEQFGVQNKELKKKVGLFETESINVPNVITISINPKEYMEEFENSTINKKHKGIKRGTPGMDFNTYFSKLCSITDYFDYYFKQKKTKIVQKRFQVINDGMQMKTVNKIQFGQLNDKKIYFPNGIISLPFGHFLLDEYRKEKNEIKNIQNQINERKWEFIKKENQILNKNERLLVFSQIINGTPTIYNLESNEPTLHFGHSTKDYIEKNYWR